MADNGQLYGRQWATVWQTMGNCTVNRSAFVVNNGFSCKRSHDEHGIVLAISIN
ncbi:MAG: hypothetical protein DSM106950_33455 [Stigonema ocellatum SAG 48.90 = DSM 106950]|nr:hypothetical protein [Stigonema ocellatum SAG 48.90 = DSM 106950]